jgi:hypothetical protein
MTNETTVPVCSIAGCGAPGVHPFGSVKVPQGAEMVLLGTVAELHPEALEGLDPEAAAILEAMEVYDTVGGTVETIEYWECEDCFA